MRRLRIRRARSSSRSWTRARFCSVRSSLRSDSRFCSLNLLMPGRLFEDRASALRVGGEHGVDPTLFHDRVGADAETGVEQQVAHVLEAQRADRRSGSAIPCPSSGDARSAPRSDRRADPLESSRCTVTSASRSVPSRPSAPLKMTSVISAPRRLFARWSPRTHLSASTTFDLPHPLGPTIPVSEESKSNSVRSANDLKPAYFETLEAHRQFVLEAGRSSDQKDVTARVSNDTA